MGKKLMSIVLAFAVMISLSIPAFAAETTKEQKSAYDLVNYMRLTDQGLIMFNGVQAITDGFSSDLVSRHQERIDFLNKLVVDGVTTISEDFTARVYIGYSRSNDNTYVEYSAWGYTVYFSVADTQKILASLPPSGLVNFASLVGLFVWPVGFVATSVAISSDAIRNAAAKGTGIWIQVYDDGTTATPLTFVGSR